MIFENFWVLLALKVVIIAAVIPGVALVFIFAELKISAHMQSRIGPYFAGGRWGWAQPLADGASPRNRGKPDLRVTIQEAR